jgi:hypothetical protein
VEPQGGSTPVYIANLNGTAAARPAQAVASVAARDRAEWPRAKSDDASTEVSVSKSAELMQQLSDLQKSDPAKFKNVVEDISEQFGQLAAASNGAEADGLSRLAQAFSKVSEKSDLTSLRADGNRNHAGVHGEGSQEARHIQAYRENAPPPPESLEKAFSAALSIVNAAHKPSSAGATNGAERAIDDPHAV